MFFRILLMLLACFFVFPSLASAMSLNFSWLPNSGPSVVGYKIYYGTASGMYQNTVDINNTAPDPSDGRIHGTVTGLTEGTKYYFVCTAYDNQGNESTYSHEVVSYCCRKGWLLFGPAGATQFGSSGSTGF